MFQLKQLALKLKGSLGAAHGSCRSVSQLSSSLYLLEHGLESERELSTLK